MLSNDISFNKEQSPELGLGDKSMHPSEPNLGWRTRNEERTNSESFMTPSRRVNSITEQYSKFKDQESAQKSGARPVWKDGKL